MENKKGFLHKVPGFRSGKKKNQVIAGVAYLYLFGGAVAGIASLAGVKAPEPSTEKEATAEQQPAKKTEPQLPEYSIVESHGSSTWYVTLETEETSEDKLRQLVEHTRELAKEQEEKVDSIFVYVMKKNSPSKNYIATGRLALNDSKGTAQTGLDVDETDFTYSYKESDHTPLPEGKNTVTADTVLSAFEKAGVSVPEARDNSHNCSDLGCVKLITTEAVSIHEWPDEAKAKEVYAKGFGDYQAGAITIRFNESHNADGSIEYEPKPSKEAYIETLNSLLN